MYITNGNAYDTISDMEAYEVYRGTNLVFDHLGRSVGRIINGTFERLTAGSAIGDVVVKVRA